MQRGRKRWAGKSYWGGRRPYGRMADPSAPRHAKRLLTVPEEAKVLQDAVTDVLDRGISLRAVAADLRNRGMRTVTGKQFSAVSLRDALLASHVAGIATCNGAQYDASSWLEPIIEPDRWERLVDMLTDPGRRTNAGNANAPRWLLSGHARVWNELSLPRQREIIRLLCEVTLFPGRRQQPFAPELQIRIDWRK